MVEKGVELRGLRLGSDGVWGGGWSGTLVGWCGASAEGEIGGVSVMGVVDVVVTVVGVTGIDAAGEIGAGTVLVRTVGAWGKGTGCGMSAGGMWMTACGMWMTACGMWLDAGECGWPLQWGALR